MAADEPGDPGDQHAHEGDFTPAAAETRRKRVRSAPGAEILERAGRRARPAGLRLGRRSSERLHGGPVEPDLLPVHQLVRGPLPPLPLDAVPDVPEETRKREPERVNAEDV